MTGLDILEVYTQAKILSLIEIDDSISDVQHKTSLSFVTTLKGINHLEKKQLIMTEKQIDKKGKSRICIWYSIEHSNFCKQLISVLENLNNYLNNDLIIEKLPDEKIEKLRKFKIVKNKNIINQLNLDLYTLD